MARTPSGAVAVDLPAVPPERGNFPVIVVEDRFDMSETVHIFASATPLMRR